MATNLSIAPELLEQALEVSGERTKRVAVTLALEQFIARRRQRGLLELMSKLEWGPGYDHERDRERRSVSRSGERSSMSLLVDTSVWSLAFRRDSPDAGAEVRALRSAFAAFFCIALHTFDALIAQLCIRHDLVLLSVAAC